MITILNVFGLWLAVFVALPIVCLALMVLVFLGLKAADLVRRIRNHQSKPTK